MTTDHPPIHSRSDAARRRALLDWYRRHRRPLPWRRTRDPYRIWVSEIMLQQTQVATMTPYYERFLARFPDVRSLAEARADDVLAAWAGLGYYGRARRLHAASRLVMRDHAGRVPSDAHAFASLPGVGRYTLGAVLSIGFGASLPVLDGNVARVLARWSARPLSIRRPRDAKALWTMAEALLAPPSGARGSRTGRDDPGEWNQALMELGATVCTPRDPRCGMCPVRRQCSAHARGTPEAWPPAAPRRGVTRVRRAIAWLERGGRVLVARRAGALLDGLWEPPGVELAPGAGGRAPLARALASLGLRARLGDTGVRVRHTITHRAIEVEVWRATLVGRAPRAAAPLRWADPAGRALALTALTRRAARALAPRARSTARRARRPGRRAEVGRSRARV